MKYETARYILITSFKRIADVPIAMNKCNTGVMNMSEGINMAKQIRLFRSVSFSGFYICEC